MNFDKIHLQEVCNVKGRIGWKGYKKTDLRDSGPIVIGGNNIKNRLYNDYSEVKHLSMDKFIESPEIILKKDEIIVVSRGNGCGDVGYYHGEYKEATINPSVVILSDITCDPKYLFYYLISKDGQERLRALISGSSIPAIYQASLRSIQVDLLPKKSQNFISSILSSFDDKIELNNKINKNLEELAQTLYKRWFVDFEFPNEDGEPYKSSGGEMVESELGLIPKGWHVLKLEDRFSFEKGIEPGSKSYETEKCTDCIAFFRVGDLDQKSNVYVHKGLVKNKLVNKSDVLVSFDGAIGRVGIGFIGSYSTGLRKVFDNENKIQSSFVYFMMKSDLIQDKIRSHANGTTILHAGSSIPFLTLPYNEKTVERYETLINPIFKKLLQLNDENNRLIKVRDELLPKLMNGEIEVPIEE